jgi:hypothetical protein
LSLSMRASAPRHKPNKGKGREREDKVRRRCTDVQNRPRKPERKKRTGDDEAQLQHHRRAPPAAARSGGGGGAFGGLEDGHGGGQGGAEERALRGEVEVRGGAAAGLVVEHLG